MKNQLFHILLSLLTFVFSCSNEEVDSEDRVRTQYILTVTVSEGGSVTPEANGAYDEGATITLTATPDEGYRFVRWDGTDNRNKTCGAASNLPPAPNWCRAGITMNSNRDVQVLFSKRTE